VESRGVSYWFGQNGFRVGFTLRRMRLR
jgi:hypothetical protein